MQQYGNSRVFRPVAASDANAFAGMFDYMFVFQVTSSQKTAKRSKRGRKSKRRWLALIQPITVNVFITDRSEWETPPVRSAYHPHQSRPPVDLHSPRWSRGLRDCLHRTSSCAKLQWQSAAVSFKLSPITSRYPLEVTHPVCLLNYRLAFTYVLICFGPKSFIPSYQKDLNLLQNISIL